MKKRCNRNLGAAVVFIGYGVLMLYLLFARNRTEAGELSYWQQVAGNVNHIPFRTILNYWDILARPEYYLSKWEAAAIYEQQARFAVVNLLGNIVMFIPFGFFLPKLWQKLQKLYRTFLTAAGVIVLIELTQLLTLRGSCDVDDLILNLFGVTAGYVFWRFWRCIVRKNMLT